MNLIKHNTYIVTTESMRIYVSSHHSASRSTVFGNKDSISENEPTIKEFKRKKEAIDVADHLNKTVGITNEKFIVTTIWDD